MICYNFTKFFLDKPLNYLNVKDLEANQNKIQAYDQKNGNGSSHLKTWWAAGYKEKDFQLERKNKGLRDIPQRTPESLLSLRKGDTWWPTVAWAWEELPHFQAAFTWFQTVTRVGLFTGLTELQKSTISTKPSTFIFLLCWRSCHLSTGALAPHLFYMILWH